MQQPFRAISLSHQSAPVEIRELIYLDTDTCRELLVQLRDRLGIGEALVFSTCNRTEVFYLSAEDKSEAIIQLLCLHAGINRFGEYLSYFKVLHEEQETVAYLFEVSMGLHSKILGDLQIAHQIKTAYSLAHDGAMAGPYLHRLLHTVFHANKRVQQETAYRDGAASVSYAAASLADELVSHLAKPKALVIGLGEMGRDVALSLDREVWDEIHVMNRTWSKAEAFALEHGFVPKPTDLPAEILSEYNLIITAVSGNDPILTKANIQQSKRGTLLIDLGVPRNIDPVLGEDSSIVLYNIDDIQERTAKALAKREASIPAVKAILQEEAKGFLEWRTQLAFSPIIQQIKDSLEQIRKEELSRFLKGANERETKLLENATRSMVNKILKFPVLHLKDACQRGDPDGLLNILREIFDLEEQPVKNS